MLRVRHTSTPGEAFGFSIERLADGLHYDFLAMAFSSTPPATMAQTAGQAIVQLLAEPSPYLGLYVANYSVTPPSVFPDGVFAVYIHNMSNFNEVVDVQYVTMHGGDDAPVIPQSWPANLVLTLPASSLPVTLAPASS